MTETYDIIYHPDPVLREVAQPIDSINADIKAQAEILLNTMYDGHGIGLAANQVGILNRMFTMDVDPDSWEYQNPDAKILEVQSRHRNSESNTAYPIVMINPEIVKESEQRSVLYEGCLSLPQQYADVERPAHIVVSYLDVEGQKHEKEFSGLESHCVQHEIDHLNGVLFIDYLSRLKRNTLVRKLEKFKKSEGLL